MAQRWSRERIDMMTLGYETGVDVAQLLEALNGLPGPPVTHSALIGQAARLRLRRPPGYRMGAVWRAFWRKEAMA
jgi:hypothetical protein